MTNEREKMTKLFTSFECMEVFVLSLFLCLMNTGTSIAAWQPRKLVEFVVPAGAGGGADVMARFISPLVSKHNFSPKPFVVINKSGGAGAEGFMYVKGKRGDPHVVDNSGTYLSYLRNLRANPEREIRDLIQSL